MSAVTHLFTGLQCFTISGVLLQPEGAPCSPVVNQVLLLQMYELKITRLLACEYITWCAGSLRQARLPEAGGQVKAKQQDTRPPWFSKKAKQQDTRPSWLSKKAVQQNMRPSWFSNFPKFDGAWG